MDNILNFPTSTHVDRLVPKTAFYKHLEINTRLKTRFVEDVERIQWLYKLTPSTMNVDEGKAGEGNGVLGDAQSERYAG